MGGFRWRIESEFETEQSDAGLGEYETRTWAGWHHHVALCLLGGVSPESATGLGEGVDPRFAAMRRVHSPWSKCRRASSGRALARRMPIRLLMMGAAFVVALAAAGTVISDWLLPEIISAAGVGFGVRGLHLLIRLVCATTTGGRTWGQSGADDVGTGGRTGAGAGNRRVHVRLFRQLPDSVYVFRRGSVHGGDHGTGGQTATGSDPGASEGTGGGFGLIRPSTSNSGRLTIPRATALLSPWRPRRLGPAFFVQTTGHETGGEVCASLGRDSSQLGMRMREDDSSNRMKTTPARLAAMDMVQARS